MTRRASSVAHAGIRRAVVGGRPCQVGGGRHKPALDRLETGGQRIGDRDEPPLLGQIEVERHLDQIAGGEGRPGRAGAAVLQDGVVPFHSKAALVV